MHKTKHTSNLSPPWYKVLTDKNQIVYNNKIVYVPAGTTSISSYLKIVFFHYFLLLAGNGVNGVILSIKILIEGKKF